jgi:transposase
VQTPQAITAVEKDGQSRKITVRIEHAREQSIACPLCGADGKVHDRRIRVLRYLGTCQYETFLEARVPRVKCAEGGVQQIETPFARKHSRFASRFETAVIVRLQGSPISAVAENFNLGWDEADGIMRRAVKRGLSRRGGEKK